MHVGNYDTIAMGDGTSHHLILEGDLNNFLLQRMVGSCILASSYATSTFEKHIIQTNIHYFCETVRIFSRVYDIYLMINNTFYLP